MTTKISQAVVQGFAALAIMGSGAAAHATPCCGNNPPAPAPVPTPPPAPAPAPVTANAAGTGIAGANAAGTGIASTGPVDTRAVAATGPVDARAVNGDLTAQQRQQAELNARQQAELSARQQSELTARQQVGQQVGQEARTGDVDGRQQTTTTTTVDASDRKVTQIDARSSSPVHTAAPHRSFLIPPSVMAQCVKFEAEEKPSWGVGLQWDYNKSIGIQYAGGSKSVSLTDLDCLTAVHMHAMRMQNLQFQHEITMQATREGVELDKMVYSTGGREGQMVVLQKRYANEVAAIVQPGSAVQQLFNLNAPKAPPPPPAPASRARAAAKAPAPAPAGSSLNIQARGAAADELAKRLATCKTGACPTPAGN